MSDLDQRRSVRRGGLAVGALCALLAHACSPVYPDLCERAATCGGGRDLEVDACVADMERREELGVIYGCEVQWDDYVGCLEDQGYCDGDKLGGCEPFKDNYEHCLDTRSAGKAKIEHEPVGAGSELEASEPAEAPGADATKPKSKCSLSAGTNALDGTSAPLAWLLSSALGLALLRRRRR